jgi:hemimethylated DNA binding protein
MTYVAERNVEPDASGTPVVHPLLGEFFSGMENGRYVRDDRSN